MVQAAAQGKAGGGLPHVPSLLFDIEVRGRGVRAV